MEANRHKDALEHWRDSAVSLRIAASMSLTFGMVVVLWIEIYAWQTIMKIVIAGQCKHDIKVTRIGSGWNVRCFVNDVINQEIRVKCREDIGVAAHEMLRNEVKNGNFSNMATAARRRFNTNEKYRRYSLQSKKVI